MKKGGSDGTPTHVVTAATVVVVVVVLPAMLVVTWQHGACKP